MRILAILFLISPLLSPGQLFTKAEITRWETRAKNVTIIRDHFGVPHIYGKTDADCVFGLMYAQCEDDFNRVESNYISMMGRTSEVTGEKDIYEDLLIRMTADSADALKDYRQTPSWMQKLLWAWADGLNYYLYKHPRLKPALITRFQPWYPLMYTDGSISPTQTAGLGAADIQAFYASKDIISAIRRTSLQDEGLTGSNGFAIAPSKSASGKSLLYINPHVTFYFRPEVQMVSEEGLNVYGAVTWGQFFVYQGFNAHCGWMHTSSKADAADLYAEQVERKNGRLVYRYNGTEIPVVEKPCTIAYKKGDSVLKKKFTVYYTQHGPVMGMRNGRWLTLKTQNRSLNGLLESWERTKARNIDEFKKALGYRANLSNNTVYADDRGNIAYWHGNFMPKRDPSYNWNEPVDGTTSATDWKGMHTVDELVHVINPASGWIQNTNNTPYSVSGPSSPDPKKYPAYMAPDGENFRGQNAVRLLGGSSSFTMESLVAAGYNTHLTAFDSSLPVLIAAYEKTRYTDTMLYAKLAEPINILRNWDHNSAENSVATTLAILWGEKTLSAIRSADPEIMSDIITRYGNTLRALPSRELLRPLLETITQLESDFGTWQLPWGELNRFQRINNDIVLKYDDARPSIPVGFASSTWGSLPSYNSRNVEGTRKRYGYGGNSFICIVEFGEKIKARSLLAGGESGDPGSPHFADQAEMYAKGKFKDVLFYKSDVIKQAERTYHPGE